MFEFLPLLIFVNNAAGNIHDQIFIWKSVFIFFSLLEVELLSQNLPEWPRNPTSGWDIQMKKVHPFEELPDCFPGQLHHFTFPPAVCKSSNFSIPWPTCVIIYLFDSSHASGCEELSHLVLIWWPIWRVLSTVVTQSGLGLKGSVWLRIECRGEEGGAG